MNKWQQLCDTVNSTKFTSEKDFENHFENYLINLFGWGQEAIERQSVVQAGHGKARPDIILKNDGKFDIVFELKNYAEKLSNYVGQLDSYIKLLESEIGVMMSPERIQVYYRPLVRSSTTTKVFDIPFEADNENGSVFCSLLDRANYSYEALCNFCKQYISETEGVGELIEKLSDTNGKKIIIESLLKNPQLNERYPERVIRRAMESIQFITRNPFVATSKNNNDNDDGATDEIKGYANIEPYLIEYSKQHFGESVPARVIQDELHEKYRCKWNEVVPSDYVSNPDSKRKTPVKIALFERIPSEKKNAPLYKSIYIDDEHNSNE